MKNILKTTIVGVSAAAIGLGLATAQDKVDKSDWKDVGIKFPRPMFIGTPVATKLPNLEKPGKPTLELKAPEGTKKISRDKPVTASDDLPIIGDLEMITDGDKDGADGSYVELGPDLQWVQIDLEKEHEVYGIVVWHFHKNARAYIDVVVQMSNDPKFEKDVVTVYNNDHDNSSKLGKGDDKAWVETNHGRVIETEGKKARYVRLYSKGNTANEMNHYVEVEVYGKE